MTDNEITTEELLSMRVVPEQQADLAVVQDALGTQKADPTDELRRMTYQRDAWRDDALAAEQRIDALKERLADRDASLAAVEAALAQLTGITPLPAAPVGGQAPARPKHAPWVGNADDGTTTYEWDTGTVQLLVAVDPDGGFEIAWSGHGEEIERSSAQPPVGGQAEPSDAQRLAMRTAVLDTMLRSTHLSSYQAIAERVVDAVLAAAAVSGEHQDATEDAQ